MKAQAAVLHPRQTKTLLGKAMLDHGDLVLDEFVGYPGETLGRMTVTIIIITKSELIMNMSM